jgi:hypothetical protein
MIPNGKIPPSISLFGSTSEAHRLRAAVCQPQGDEAAVDAGFSRLLVDRYDSGA